MPARRPRVQKKKRVIASGKRSVKKNTRGKEKYTQEIITGQMTLAEILSLCPQATDVLMEYGLHCVGCHFNTLETLQEGCNGHGFSQAETRNLIEDLNELMRNTPPRPMTLIITDTAAKAIQSIATANGKLDEGLAVIADDIGGFCMEFRKEKHSDEIVCANSTVPTVRIFASTQTLARIGGATIDFRENRFKLDMPQEMDACHCSAKCKCKEENQALSK